MFFRSEGTNRIPRRVWMGYRKYRHRQSRFFSVFLPQDELLLFPNANSTFCPGAVTFVKLKGQ